MSSCLKRARSAGARVRTAALLACGVCGLGAVSAGGCGYHQPQATAPTPPAMDIDPAMQRRDWERSVAWYPNGDVVAGVNRFPIRYMGGNPADPDYTNALLDLGAAAIQTVALPFTYLVIPPFAAETFKEEDVPPTYTAMPYMRPERQTRQGVKPAGTAEQLERLESPEPLPPPEADRPPTPQRDPRIGPLGPGDIE